MYKCWESSAVTNLYNWRTRVSSCSLSSQTCDALSVFKDHSSSSSLKAINFQCRKPSVLIDFMKVILENFSFFILHNSGYLYFQLENITDSLQTNYKYFLFVIFIDLFKEIITYCVLWGKNPISQFKIPLNFLHN